MYRWVAASLVTAAVFAAAAAGCGLLLRLSVHSAADRWAIASGLGVALAGLAALRAAPWAARAGQDDDPGSLPDDRPGGGSGARATGGGIGIAGNISGIASTGPNAVNIVNRERSALDTMRHDLSHEDAEVRIKAARRLALAPYREAVHDVIRQLRREERIATQAWLVQALGSAGGDDAIQALNDYAESPAAQNPLIKSRVSKALVTAREGGLRFESAGRRGGPR